MLTGSAATPPKVPATMESVWPAVRPESVDARIRRMVELHFHPTDGSAYWLDRARDLGIDPLQEIHCLDDLSLLGDTPPQDLRRRPLLDYLPRRLHRRMDLLTVCQTGGTTGA